MNYYLFESDGGEFFVVAEKDFEEALSVASIFFPEGSTYIDKITEYDADVMDLDVY